MDKNTMKEIMFAIFDINKDKYICETDLYNLIMMIDDKYMRMAITPDILTVIQHIHLQRKKVGKDDIVKMKT